MKVFANKSLFRKENLFLSAYYSIRSWFRYTFNKYHVKLVNEAFKGRPWDEGFLIDLEAAKIREMVDYHQRVQRFEGVEYVIRDMKLCLSLIEIFTGKRDIFHYTGKLEFVEADKETEKDLGEKGLFELKESPDFKYHCDVVVNTKNADRFVNDKRTINFYLEHPHELYELKARYLYHKIRFEREEEWWD